MAFTGFATRTEAGRRLASQLAAMHCKAPVVLALPRGGVPVALEVARHLKAPLDLVMVRKIGVPWQPEVAAAAVVDGERPDLVRNDSVITATGMSAREIDSAKAVELAEIERRRKIYLGSRPAVSVAGQTAIVVDDGIATGTTMRAALVALRRRKPQRLILAVPVAPADTLAELAPEVDDIVCLERPSPFYAIGEFYRDFHQVSDAEVIAMLASLRPSEPG